MKSSIAQRLSQLGVGLESADLMTAPEETPVVDPTTTEVVDTLALTDAQSEVDEAEGVLDRLQEDHSELTEVAAALESFLASADPISPMVASALAIPVRRATQAYGLSNSIPSVESFGTSQEAIRANLRASLEATDSRLEQIGTWIKDVFKALLEKIVALWEQLTDRFGALRKNAEAILQSIKADGAAAEGKIQVPVAIARRLVVEGEMPKDLRQPMRRLSILMEAQFQDISQQLMDNNAELTKAAEALIETATTKLPTTLQPQIDEYVAKANELQGESMKKVELADKESWIKTSASMRTKPLMGNESLVIGQGLFKLTCGVEVSGDFPEDPVEIDRLTPDVAEELLSSVISICDVMAKFDETKSRRKEMYARMEKIASKAAVAQYRSIFNSQFLREFTQSLTGVIQTAKALEGTAAAHAFRSCSAIVALCKLAAAPAPAQA